MTSPIPSSRSRLICPAPGSRSSRCCMGPAAGRTSPSCPGHGGSLPAGMLFLHLSALPAPCFSQIKAASPRERSWESASSSSRCQRRIKITPSSSGCTRAGKMPVSDVKMPGWPCCRAGSKGLPPSFLGPFPREVIPGNSQDPPQGFTSHIWEAPAGIFTPCKTHHQQGPHGAVPWLIQLFQVQRFLHLLELSIRGTQPNPAPHPVGVESLGIPKIPSLAPGGTQSLQTWSFHSPAWRFRLFRPPPTPCHTNPTLSLLRSHPSQKGLSGSAAGRAELTLRAGIPKRNL